MNSQDPIADLHLSEHDSRIRTYGFLYNHEARIRALESKMNWILGIGSGTIIGVYTLLFLHVL